MGHSEMSVVAGPESMKRNCAVVSGGAFFDSGLADDARAPDDAGAPE
jgi:hypothetical protein